LTDGVYCKGDLSMSVETLQRRRDRGALPVVVGNGGRRQFNLRVCSDPLPSQTANKVSSRRRWYVVTEVGEISSHSECRHYPLAPDLRDCRSVPILVRPSTIRGS